MLMLNQQAPKSWNTCDPWQLLNVKLLVEECDGVLIRGLFLITVTHVTDSGRCVCVHYVQGASGNYKWMYIDVFRKNYIVLDVCT